MIRTFLAIIPIAVLVACSSPGAGTGAPPRPTPTILDLPGWGSTPFNWHINIRNTESGYEDLRATIQVDGGNGQFTADLRDRSGAVICGIENMPITVDSGYSQYTLTFSHTADQSCTSAFTRFNGGLRAGDILDFELDWYKSEGPDPRNPNRQIIHVSFEDIEVHRPNPGSGTGSMTFWFSGSLTYN